jgi:hypothetical protein
MEELETIVFRWTRNHGDCYDCGKPAAFQTNLKIRLCVCVLPTALPMASKSHESTQNSEQPQRELGSFGCSPTKVKQPTFYRNNKQTPTNRREIQWLSTV